MSRKVILLSVFAFLVALGVAAFPSPAAAVGPVSVRATVNVPELHIRRGPYAIGTILGVLTKGETVNAVGRDLRATWLQVRTAYGVGWINTRFVTLSGDARDLSNTENDAPILAFFLEATAYIRLGPDKAYPLVYTATDGEVMDVIGVDRQRGWYEVRLPKGAETVYGWTNFKNIRLYGPYLKLPDTGTAFPPFARINNYRVNLRSAPMEDAQSVLLAELGQLYVIIGRNKASTWYFVHAYETKAIQGWMRADLVKTIGRGAIPVIP
ncbi:MAG TPA: hypothetical protein PLD47_09835 [Aggregatilineales bacterium]|nr:hypothetical protein [Anaerolineales bacterium]HRE48013.1 hypothetical protein [Aggregatilineales bacterium]